MRERERLKKRKRVRGERKARKTEEWQTERCWKVSRLLPGSWVPIPWWQSLTNPWMGKGGRGCMCDGWGSHSQKKKGTAGMRGRERKETKHFSPSSRPLTPPAPFWQKLESPHYLLFSELTLQHKLIMPQHSPQDTRALCLINVDGHFPLAASLTHASTVFIIKYTSIYQPPPRHTYTLRDPLQWWTCIRQYFSTDVKTLG